MMLSISVVSLKAAVSNPRLPPAAQKQDTPTRIISSNNESGDGATAGLQLVAAAPMRSRGAPHRA